MDEQLRLLLDKGNIGFYDYCQITYILLFDGENWINYFTHIDFSERYKELKKIQYLTKSPKTIKGKYKLCVTQECVSVDKIDEFWNDCITNSSFKTDEIVVSLDKTFVSGVKFIPEVDPTGGQFNLYVPLEKYLYGTNFSGNYYILEFMSSKNELNNIFEQVDYEKIQKILDSIGVRFKLNILTDRIGNVIFKFPVEIIRSKLIKLNSQIGIELELTKDTRLEEERSFTLIKKQEFDSIIYDFRVINNFNFSHITVAPNQNINTVTVTDNKTGLIVYSQTFDYRILVSYKSAISLPYICCEENGKRTLLVDGQSKDVCLSGKHEFGKLFINIENELVNKRMQRVNDLFLKEYKQLLSYDVGEHDKAIRDIVDIINNPVLLWDLYEIDIMDPYLTPKDLIDTVFNCEKGDIKIKALCCNKRIRECNDEDPFKKQIDICLGDESDISLDYRIVRDGYGVEFHDRYIILKYDLNGVKVYSLGSSINSIGNKHTIIHTVETPSLISDVFLNIWQKVQNDICILYKS